MGMDMDAYSKALMKRHKRQIENKDTRTAFRSALFDYEKMPEGVSIWSPKDGDHLIDIIPFTVGSQMPLDRQTGGITAKEGEIDYLVDVDVHCRIGADRMDFVCPRSNFGKPCPICQYLRNEGSGNDELWRKYKTTRRTIYLVWVHDSPEDEAKGIQIWNVAHFFMENKLQPLATLPRGGGYKMYSHPNEGSNISFTIRKKGMGNVEFLGHALYDRERPIPQSILNRTFPLDEVIKMHPSYEEMQEAFRSALTAEETTAFGQSDQDPFPAKGAPAQVPQQTSSVDWYDDEDDSSDEQTLEDIAQEETEKVPRKPLLKKPFKGNMQSKKLIRRH